MKIYTRTGDEGTTGLFGGDRVSKSHPRIEAYGTVDEANSVVGVALSALGDEEAFGAARRMLGRIQSDLFVLGADLATPAEGRPFVPRIAPSMTTLLEQDIDALEAELSPLKHFILPGGHPAAAQLHLARTVCRRAERLAVEAASHEMFNEHAIVYLNRLSDLLFVMARWVNARAGAGETKWIPETTNEA